MRKLWSDRAWEDYLYWQTQDRKTIRRINNLLREIERSGSSSSPSMGKVELLKYSRQGLASARIDKSNRLVYKLENDTLYIHSCRGHYTD